MNFSLYKCVSILFLTVSVISISLPSVAHAQQMESTVVEKKLADLENASGGRLGLWAINTANNSVIQYRAAERFPFCSTGKVMVVATILKDSEKNSTLLQKQINYTQKNVDDSGYAPITKQHVASGMKVNALCQAAMDYSDNTAMNLLLQAAGGPKAVTAYARSIHDATYRLDRFEPTLNTAIPGDLRDTTTPVAMANSLQQLTLGHLLTPSLRNNLITLLKNNTTGDSRIRAGVPKGWIVGDKTGTGDFGTTNDIAVIWPPNCSPLVIAIYFTQNKKDAPHREDVIVRATRIVLNEFIHHEQCINKRS